MSLTITDIVTEFGQYYINNGQNMNDLVKLLHRASKTAALFPVRNTQDTQIRKSQFDMTSVLQPFQKTFSPASTLTFTPRKLDLFKMKVDAQEYPDELEQSWLGFLDNIEDVNRANWPFVRWFMERYLIPKKNEDFEMKAAYTGIYSAPAVPGTAGNPEDSMDGIKFKINTFIDDGDLTPITTGALATDAEDFCDQIEAFWEDVDKRYWKLPMKLAMSEEKELLFRQGKRLKYNMNYLQEANLESIAHFPNVQVVGLPSMDGSGKIWATPAENMVNAIKKASLVDTIAVEQQDRLVKFFGDWWQVLGFWIPEIIFTNDQDLELSGS